MIPLVSICIPTYNGQAFIEACMDSAIKQTHQNLEIIISDDASKDNTLALIESYRTRTEIPIYIHKHQPKGIGANWNNCVKHANGAYIKFLFQDDVLHPDCIERMMSQMLSAANIGLVYVKRNFLYETETPAIKDFISVYGQLHNYWRDLKVKEGIIEGKAYLYDRSFLNAPKNKIGEPTSVLLRKSCFDTVGYFDETMKQALDCEYWYRLMPHYAVGFVDANLSSFRLHDQQASAINKSEKINETEPLYYSYYKHLLAFLNKQNRWKLQKMFHPLIAPLVRLKYKLVK